MAAVDLTRVTVATTFEDRPPYNDEAIVLFASLQKFGGALCMARWRAYLIDGVSRETERRLAELGVEVCVRDAVNARFPLANKLRMFDPSGYDDSDLLVALDGDIVIAGDIAECLDPTLLQAKQVDGDGLSFTLWERLFSHFGLDLPNERYPTSLESRWTHAYLNTGVLLVPTPYLPDIHARWLHYIDAIVNDTADTFADLARHIHAGLPACIGGCLATELRPLYFAEQWAFSLARHELAVPYAVLPLAMNFPSPYIDSHKPGSYIRSRFLPHAITPLLVHHHHSRTADGLRRSGYRGPDRVVADINATLFSRRAAPALAGLADA